MQDATFTALFGNARYSRTTPHLVILHIRTRGIAILIEPGSNSLAQKDCYIHVPGEEYAEVLARIVTHTHTHIRTPARWVKERYDKTKEMAER